MKIETVTPHPTFSHFGHVTVVLRDVSNDELKWLQEHSGLNSIFDVKITTEDAFIEHEGPMGNLIKKLNYSEERMGPKDTAASVPSLSIKIN